ncbi:MAG: 50S ribosomal protein L30 [Chloroflexota bacterium]|nr:50S ribosomal protein L30 [Chloroflexota bacterium]MDE2839074.1 50S ribosomal protein L30 [Chloroflexota bacterium]MDE2929786.1 50S ribosomal protein L30 [Chloroflexota bacterium]
MSKTPTSSKTLRITLRKSPIGFSKDQKQTIAALGLRKREQSVEHNESPTVRGMIKKVAHLVDVEEAS